MLTHCVRILLDAFGQGAHALSALTASGFYTSGQNVNACWERVYTQALASHAFELSSLHARLSLQGQSGFSSNDMKSCDMRHTPA